MPDVEDWEPESVPDELVPDCVPVDEPVPYVLPDWLLDPVEG